MLQKLIISWYIPIKEISTTRVNITLFRIMYVDPPYGYTCIEPQRPVVSLLYSIYDTYLAFSQLIYLHVKKHWKWGA